jgi:hypothetical protein
MVSRLGQLLAWLFVLLHACGLAWLALLAGLWLAHALLGALR